VSDFVSGALPGAAYTDLCKFSGTISDLASNASALEASWNQLKAEDAVGTGPLVGTYPNSTTITTQIETYATDHNIPLVAP